MDRVSVVGNSGSGKSTLARRIAERLDLPYVELDAIYHQPGWTELDRDEFVARVEGIAAGDRWVIDGNYREVVADGPVWRRADTVVWLNLPRRTVMRQVVRRSLRRVVRREELWAGNRESWRNLLSWNPDRSIVRWAWTNHHKYRQRFSQIPKQLPDVNFVELRSHAAAEEWLAGSS